MRSRITSLTGIAAAGLVGFALAGCGGTLDPSLLPPECQLENAPPSCESGDPPVESVVPVDRSEAMSDLLDR